ncbi:hypothetical protein G6F68_011388 [Rhizopus microsporus]|nr:hypothetical protein G6F68_011388 [Rhizopus microsporus]
MPRAGWAGRPTPVLPCAQERAHEQAAAKPPGMGSRRPRTPTPPRHPTECPLLTLTLTWLASRCRAASPAEPPTAVGWADAALQLGALGSLKEGGRDGTLIVVSRDLRHGVRATGIAATLQQALEDWSRIAPRLNALYESLNAGDADGVFDLDPQALAAPMPRAYEFVDGSAYLPHVERVRRARGAEVPESFYTDPLMYQATSAGFYGPRDAVKVVSEDYGIDLEAEIVVITDDVPMAATPEQAAGHIQLVGLVNDVSLRNLIPGELAKGFGCLQTARCTCRC